MKNRIIIFSAVLLFCAMSGCGREKAPVEPPGDESLTVFCTPELTDITTAWANDYNRSNPGNEIRIVTIDHASIPEYLGSGKALGFTTGPFSDDAITNSEWREAVARDVIVPVYNPDNPYRQAISAEGVTVAEFTAILGNRGARSWSSMLSAAGDSPINLYMTGQPGVKDGITKLTGHDNFEGTATVRSDSRDLVEAIRSDKYSIGICRLTDITDPVTGELVAGISLLPIDRNANGRIDYMEDIYEDAGVLARGVWIGKYPKALSNNIYSVASVIPRNNNLASYLQYVITDGQQELSNFGYSDLQGNERLAMIDILAGDSYYEAEVENYSVARSPLQFIMYFPIFLTAAIIIFFLSVSLYQRARERSLAGPEPSVVASVLLNESSVKSPTGLYYDRSHTWAFMEEDGLVRVGIDDFLLRVTGPITGLKMKLPGERVRKGKQIVSIIQNGKQLDISASISGTIVEYNRQLEGNSALLNSDPYEGGWIYKIEPTNWLKEIQFLIMGSSYREWLRSEFERLKEFLTGPIKSASPEFARVMQDGGELRDGILQELGPKSWEDFQTSFLDA